MPLSEHEQRILADIEARLRADDPQFAESVGTQTVSSHLRGRLKWFVLAFLVGFVLLFVGLQVHLLWGVLGFALMLASAYQTLSVLKRLAAAADNDESAGGPLQRYMDSARRRDDEDR